MKKIIIAFAAIVVASFSFSCGTRQKPTPRVNPWDKSESIKTTMSSDKVLVPFKRTAEGLVEVQVSLNGVPFNMWWDTGASITSISALELQKLAKDGKIALDDVQGLAISRLADGSSTENVVYNIKEIIIQGKDNKYLRLNDVAAIVSANEDAPLLIGQNVIRSLPQHTFNNTTGEIEFDR